MNVFLLRVKPNDCMSCRCQLKYQNSVSRSSVFAVSPYACSKLRRLLRVDETAVDLAVYGQGYAVYRVCLDAAGGLLAKGEISWAAARGSAQRVTAVIAKSGRQIVEDYREAQGCEKAENLQYGMQGDLSA